MNKIGCILDKNIMRFYVVNIGVTTLSIIFLKNDLKVELL